MYVSLIIIYYRSHFGSRLFLLHNHIESTTRFVFTRPTMPRVSPQKFARAVQKKQQTETKEAWNHLLAYNPLLNSKPPPIKEAQAEKMQTKTQETKKPTKNAKMASMTWNQLQENQACRRAMCEKLRSSSNYRELIKYLHNLNKEEMSDWMTENQPWKARPPLLQPVSSAMKTLLTYELTYGILEEFSWRI